MGRRREKPTPIIQTTSYFESAYGPTICCPRDAAFSRANIFSNTLELTFFADNYAVQRRIVARCECNKIGCNFVIWQDFIIWPKRNENCERIVCCEPSSNLLWVSQ